MDSQDSGVNMRLPKVQASVILFVACLGLAACGPSDEELYYNKMKPLTNQQIVEQVTFCTKNHFMPWTHENGFHQTVQIECYDKDF